MSNGTNEYSLAEHHSNTMQSRSLVPRVNAGPIPPSAQIAFRQRSRENSVDGKPVVRQLARALTRLPRERKDWLRKTLWPHKNKRRVRLQRVGGDRGTNGRAYVIDSATTVDGVTRRMKSVVHNECRRASEATSRFYDNDAQYKRTCEALERLDGRYDTCPNLFSRHSNSRRERGGDGNGDDYKNKAMVHGSKVHMDVYHIIRHALHESQLHKCQQGVARNFRIDPCAHACVMGMLTKGLYPFSSEWPVFSVEGTGIATAVDALAFDRRKNFAPALIEIKTGSASKAMDLRVANSRDISGFGMVAAAIQVALTRELMLSCYKDAFAAETRLNAYVVYARTWGVVKIDVPYRMLSRAQVQQLLKVMLHQGTTMRQSLPTHKNHQSHLTANNKPRRRTPKQYTVGFDSTANVVAATSSAT